MSCSYKCSNGKKCKNKAVRTNEFCFCTRHERLLDNGKIQYPTNTVELCRYLKDDKTLCCNKVYIDSLCYRHRNVRNNEHSEGWRVLDNKNLKEHNCNCEFCIVDNFRYIGRETDKRANIRKKRASSADGRLQSDIQSQYISSASVSSMNYSNSSSIGQFPMMNNSQQLQQETIYPGPLVSLPIEYQSSGWILTGQLPPNVKQYAYAMIPGGYYSIIPSLPPGFYTPSNSIQGILPFPPQVHGSNLQNNTVRRINPQSLFSQNVPPLPKYPQGNYIPPGMQLDYSDPRGYSEVPMSQSSFPLHQSLKQNYSNEQGQNNGRSNTGAANKKGRKQDKKQDDQK